MENLKIKSPDGSSGNKNSLSQRKKCSWKPLHQSSTSGRQNFRTSGQVNKIEKTCEFIQKRMQKFENDMQELCDFIKRPYVHGNVTINLPV
jgi:hypothetical protein